MRQYYYLTELDDSPYELTTLDALHLGSTDRLEIYAFAAEEITLENAHTGAATAEHNVYLQLHNHTTREVEKGLAQTRSPLSESPASNSTPPCYLVRDARVTGKWRGFDPEWEPFLDDYLAIPHSPGGREDEAYTVRLADLLCWVDDLERMTENGEIKRRDSDEQPAVSEPPGISELPEKLRQLYVAFACGEQPDLEAMIDAWYLHWHQRASRGERDTYSSNDKVAAWLTDRGMANGKATSAPPLIRPKWGK